MAQSVYGRLGSTTIPAPDQVARRHVVGGDETIQAIAQKEYPDLGYSAEAWRQLAEANAVTDLDAVAAGLVLQVPTPQATS